MTTKKSTSKPRSRKTNRYSVEFKKDRTSYTKNQPHHPMTPGRIERFWKSFFTEFLSRVQFDSFEDAQQCLSLWVRGINCIHAFIVVGEDDI